MTVEPEKRRANTPEQTTRGGVMVSRIKYTRPDADFNIVEALSTGYGISGVIGIGEEIRQVEIKVNPHVYVPEGISLPCRQNSDGSLSLDVRFDEEAPKIDEPDNQIYWAQLTAGSSKGTHCFGICCGQKVYLRRQNMPVELRPACQLVPPENLKERVVMPIIFTPDIEGPNRPIDGAFIQRARELGRYHHGDSAPVSVYKIVDNGALFTLGDYSSGLIPLNEYGLAGTPKAGDQTEIFVRKVYDRTDERRHHYVIGSIKEQEAWSRWTELLKIGAIYSGLCEAISVAHRIYVCRLPDGFTVRVPTGYIMRRYPNLDIGDTIDLRVTRINEKLKRIEV